MTETILLSTVWLQILSFSQLEVYKSVVKLLLALKAYMKKHLSHFQGVFMFNMLKLFCWKMS
jgi:hypothetical protein